MTSIDKWFPTSIYNTKLDDMESYKDSFINRALEVSQKCERVSQWRCDTYNTLDSSYDLSTDAVFAPLIETCIKHVEQFSMIYGVHKPIVTLNNGWINIAEPGSYQEYHIHSDCHFSLVYYIQAEPNSGNIVFRSCESNTDMFPVHVDENNEFNYKTCFYRPEANRVLIFRSNLLHMVEKNHSDANRISIAMNFNVRK
jgi:uncharacterized protein (TIGR02466 family)